MALTTVVSAGSATAAVADSSAPSTPSTPTAPTAPHSPLTSPLPKPTPTPPADPITKPSPTPSPAPKPTTPAPTHPKAGAGHFDNALIATTALTYVGRWGGQACLDANRYASGQCREFVDCVVSLATGGKVWPVDPGGDYQVGFSSAGAVPVAAADAVEGDIIQIGDHDDATLLHTAIVVANKGNGSFTVVDSNWVGWPTTPELVGVHDWAPPAGARIWRLGAVAAGSGTTTAAGTKKNSSGAVKGTAGANGTQTPDTLLAPPTAPNLSTNTVGGLASGVISVRAADGDPQHPSTRVRYWIDGKPADAADSNAGAAVLQLDTTKLSDGAHQISAQAITKDGAISALAAPTTITVTNHQLTLAVAAPNAPMVTGSVSFAVGAAPAADVDKATLMVDGAPAQTQPATPSGAMNLDTTTLTAGPHVVAISLTNREGQTAAWGPVTITVTGAATGLRAVLPSATKGHADLVAVDAAGRLVRYPWSTDATFGTPQPVADGFGDVTALVAGHLVTATGPAAPADAANAPHLLAVRKDGSAHVYGFDNTGKLVDQGTITGPAWNTYTRLAVGRFAKDAQPWLVGIDAAGHAQLITLAADGKTAKAEGLSVDPALGAAPTILTEAAAGGVDRLVGVTTSGAVAAFEFDAKHGFVKAKDEPLTQLPTPVATPVFGGFVGTGPEVLVTGVDGQTWVLSATQPDKPAQGAVFNVRPDVPQTAPAVSVVPGQRRFIPLTD